MIKKRTFSLLTILLLALTFLFLTSCQTATVAVEEEEENEEITEEMILSLAHPDERGERIMALEDYDEDESWAVYIYMVGSNLESGNVNALSSLTKLLISDEIEDNRKESKEKMTNSLRDFIADLDSIDMELPSSFFLPYSPSVNVYSETDDEWDGVTYLSYFSFASDNIDQIIDVPVNGKVKYIIQSGGANAWSNLEINPNRRERFIIDTDGFRKLESSALENMADPETLSSFLKFCTDNYDADHKILVFWNHGGGPFGFGQDEIFNDLLSLNEMCKALSDVYGENPEVKPFDIIGFNACLMGSIEVAKALSPFATYLVASEEVAYSPFWDFGALAYALSENPSIHAEKLAKAIIDGFTEQFARINIESGDFSAGLVSTLSLVDMEKVLKVYDAYSDFAKTVLLDSAADLKNLSIVSREALDSIAFGTDSYDVFNLIDLKIFMENASEYYPEEAEAVLNALDDAVLYSRGTSYGNYTGGLSVYYPLYLDNIYAVYYMLQYIDEIATDDAVKALYYYKLAGALNEEHSAYLKTLGVENALKHDSSLLNELINAKGEIDGNSIRIPISTEQYSLLQNANVNLQVIRDDTAIDLGYIAADLEENAITLDFDGEWIMVNDHIPLSLDEISRYGSVTSYSSPVLINEEEYSLILSYDEDSDTVYINGISPTGISDSGIIIAETVLPLESDMEITPIHTIYYTEAPGILSLRARGDDTFKGDDDIAFSLLPDGFYILSIGAFDFRGDEYIAPPISFSIEDSAIIDFGFDDSISVSIFN